MAEFLEWSEMMANVVNALRMNEKLGKRKKREVIVKVVETEMKAHLYLTDFVCFIVNCYFSNKMLCYFLVVVCLCNFCFSYASDLAEKEWHTQEKCDSIYFSYRGGVQEQETAGSVSQISSWRPLEF